MERKWGIFSKRTGSNNGMQIIPESQRRKIAEINPHLFGGRGLGFIPEEPTGVLAHVEIRCGKPVRIV